MDRIKMKKVTVLGVEYVEDELTPEQLILASHIGDLNRKLSSAKFNIDQMQVGLNTFHQFFERSLKSESR